MPGISTSRISQTDQAGRTTEQDVTDVTQQYTLSLNKTIYPNLGFSGTGLISKDLTWTHDSSGATSQGDQTAATLATRLSFGSGILGGALSYDRRQEVSTGQGGWATENTYGLNAGWHPLELPSIDLRLTRTDIHDPTRPDPDSVEYTGQLGVGYTAIPGLELRYTLRLDELTRSSTDSTTVSQDGRASYRTTLLDGRTTAYGSVAVTSLWSQTISSDPNGAVAVQRFAIQGLSLVEDFPALPENDVLVSNPALVNGDVRSSAAVNLGFSVGPTDRRPRDLGVQLADVVTKVNRITVWVDRALPVTVSRAFQWDAYQSDDNQHWTLVPITGPVLFGDLENRFDIPIVETAARYLKVVTKPLDASVTTDPRWKDILVTEVQLFDDVPAAQVRGVTSRVGQTFNGAAQTRLLDHPNLSHDVSVTLTRSGSDVPTTWTATNGLSIMGLPSPTTTLSARVARQDSDAGTGHVGSFQWTGTLAHQPLPTLAEGLTYGGQLTQSRLGTALSNSVAGYARAEVYKGVAGTGNASYAVTSNADGSQVRAATATVGASLVPNRVLSLTGTYGVSRAETDPAGNVTPTATTIRQRVDSNVTFTPVPALYASAGLSRVFGDVRPTTLGNFSLNLSPFPDGQLLARATYSESVDTGADSRTRIVSPSLRWTMRAGMFLDLAYGDIRSWSLVEATRIQTASASLTLVL
jgi:hypothetical protein